jgi:hypothetical protein
MKCFKMTTHVLIKSSSAAVSAASSVYTQPPPLHKRSRSSAKRAPSETSDLISVVTRKRRVQLSEFPFRKQESKIYLEAFQRVVEKLVPFTQLIDVRRYLQIHRVGCREIYNNDFVEVFAVTDREGAVAME